MSQEDPTNPTPFDDESTSAEVPGMSALKTEAVNMEAEMAARADSENPPSGDVDLSGKTEAVVMPGMGRPPAQVDASELSTADVGSLTPTDPPSPTPDVAAPSGPRKLRMPTQSEILDAVEGVETVSIHVSDGELPADSADLFDSEKKRTDDVDDPSLPALAAAQAPADEPPTDDVSEYSAAGFIDPGTPVDPKIASSATEDLGERIPPGAERWPSIGEPVHRRPVNKPRSRLLPTVTIVVGLIVILLLILVAVRF